MRLQGVLLLIWAVSGCLGKFYYASSSRVLKLDEVVNITNALFPEEAPPTLRQSWSVSTQRGAFLHLTCSLIRVPKNTPCGNDVFVVSDGIRTMELCGEIRNFEKYSFDHSMLMFMRTNDKGGGILDCQMKAVPTKGTPTEPTKPAPTEPAPVSSEEEAPGIETTTESKWAYLDVKSVEIDSSEDGGPPGRRKTSCPCGWANKDSKRIFGGRDTAVNEFPWMAGVSYLKPVTIFCGATVLTPTHALTAAQCIHEKKGPFALVLGEHDKKNRNEDKNVQVINIKQIIEHEEYQTKRHLNDIALVVLEKKIEFSKTVGPICLPVKPVNVERKYVKAIGWGKTRESPYGSTMLMKVNLRVVPKSTCSAINSGLVPEGSPKQICTYARRKSTCSYGDSGGPLAWLDPSTNRFTLVGVISYGTQDCGTGIPRINTDVSAYLDWIKKNIKETDSSVQTCNKAR